MRAIHCAAGWLLLCAAAFGAQIPPKPAKYFNDYAGLVSTRTAEGLNRALEEFERQTSSQILVAIFPKLPADAALEEFAVQTFRAWGPGQKDKNNGAVLFIFRDDRQMRIEVGYGLEGAIPDSIAGRIIENEIAPRFRSGNFDAGVAAGVNALLQAARGEYRGTGTTVHSRRNRGGAGGSSVLIAVFIIALIVASGVRKRGTMYHRRRRGYWTGWGGGLGSGWGGGSWGGGGGGWSGGGGFMGGGGRSGGGGASGGW